MALPLTYKFLIAAIAIFGGWPLMATVMWVMRKMVMRKPMSFRDCCQPLDLWVGGSERFVAIILMIWAAPYLPGFIGGWVALKFAANWQRIKSANPDVRQGSLMALVGSVFSFTIAIIAALIIKPDVVASLMK